MSEYRGLVERLRKHAYRIISETAAMRSGYGVMTEPDDRIDMEAALDEAADAIERLERNMQIRDEFIVNRGLWTDFTASLP